MAKIDFELWESEIAPEPDGRVLVGLAVLELFFFVAFVVVVL